MDLFFCRDLRFRDLRVWELDVGTRTSSLWAQPFWLLVQPSWLLPLLLLARRLRPLCLLARRLRPVCLLVLARRLRPVLLLLVLARRLRPVCFQEEVCQDHLLALRLLVFL